MFALASEQKRTRLGLPEDVVPATMTQDDGLTEQQDLEVHQTNHMIANTVQGAVERSGPASRVSTRQANNRKNAFYVNGVKTVSTSETGPVKVIPEHEVGYAFAVVLTRDMRGSGLDRMSLNKGLKLCGDEAVKAAVDEMMQLFETKQCMRPVFRKDLSHKKLRKVIQSSMFFKAKFDASGSFEKLKARLVAWGNLQDRDDYPDRHAPTVAMPSLKMCLIIAARENRKAAVFDIGGAFLCCEMTGEEVIIEVDATLSAIIAKHLPRLEMFLDKRGKLLCTLDKALYGLVQSAKLWYDKLIGVLETMGYVRNPNDPCVLNKMCDGVQCTLLIHVDDILALCVNQVILDDLLKALLDVFEKVSSKTGNELSYLGMVLGFSDHVVTVTMGGYVDVMLSEFGDVTAVTSPATGDVFELIPGSPDLEADKLKFFHTNVAKLLYYTMRCKVAISVAVSFLCTRVTCATEQDLKKLNRVMGYVKHTRHTGVVLQGSGELVVKGYVDAGFGSHADGKSHTGLAIMLGNACVEFKSSKQKIVTKDSTEAELVGASDRVPNIMYCQEFLTEQGLKLPLPILMQDNQSAIHWMTIGSGLSRNKHLRVRKFGIKELLDNKELVVEYTPTEIMKADILTKALQGNLFRKHLRSIDNVESG